MYVVFTRDMIVYVVFTRDMIVYVCIRVYGQFCKYADNCLCMNL